jgi:Asp-tRNA(Asn)/Glu-tRNA(Gln) amidotransferase A subunit family amidase
MTGAPWQGDACSLVDAFRSGDRSPIEELEASLAAITASDLNAFSCVDAELALATARRADVSLPFGGVPTGIKELEAVEGWPDTGASLVFEDRIADHTSHYVARLLGDGGAVPVGLTTSSEFGGLNVSVTKLNGVTHNPWRHGRTVGGSSAGSSAAVAGGLVSLATGGDGGGSIRIPAGYTGLLGFKGTFGRVTRAPHAYMRPNTVVNGCLSRSVRDVARFLDVTAGPDGYDPTTLPASGGWERGLGAHDLRGRRAAIVPSIGGAALDPGVEEHIRARAEELVADAGMTLVDVTIDLPNLAGQWMMGNLATLIAHLGDAWPGCLDELTEEVAMGALVAQALYNLHTAAVGEQLRVRANEVMASTFDAVDVVITATNPGPAFAAEATKSSAQTDLLDLVRTSRITKQLARGGLFVARVASAVAPRLPNALIDWAGRRFPDMVAMGALTIISNVYGNPAVSIPAGTVDGLPVGLQALAPRHADALLLDVALSAERHRPWPLIAPTATATAARPVATT